GRVAGDELVEGVALADPLEEAALVKLILAKARELRMEDVPHAVAHREPPEMMSLARRDQARGLAHNVAAACTEAVRPKEADEERVQQWECALDWFGKNAEEPLALAADRLDDQRRARRCVVRVEQRGEFPLPALLAPDERAVLILDRA